MWQAEFEPRELDHEGMTEGPDVDVVPVPGRLLPPCEFVALEPGLELERLRLQRSHRPLVAQPDQLVRIRDKAPSLSPAHVARKVVEALALAVLVEAV